MPTRTAFSNKFPTTRHAAKTILICWVIITSPPFSFSADLQIATEGESLPSGVVNKPYPFFQLKGSGGTPPYKWHLGTNGLPSGLNLDQDSGRIYGKPSEISEFKQIDIRLIDEKPNTVEKPYFLTIYPDAATKDASINHVCFTEVGERGALGDLGSNWSVGPAVTTQLIRYNFNNQKASFNAKGIGVGAAIRYYADNDITVPPNSPQKDIRRVKPECRATTISTFQGSTEKIKATSTISITPTIFASFDDAQSGSSGQGQLNVQPAIILGFWRDLINIGVGWNLAGQNKGQAFLLMGIGTGFSF